MNGIQALDPLVTGDKAKQIAMSGDPQTIMSALSGQAGVDPYKVLAAVKAETDKRAMMQQQMGAQAIQQASQTPQTTIAQELMQQLQPQQQQAPQGPGFARGGAVSGDAEEAFASDPNFVKFVHSFSGGWGSSFDNPYDPVMLGQVKQRLTNSGKLKEYYDIYRGKNSSTPTDPTKSFSDIANPQPPARKMFSPTFENLGKYSPTLAPDDAIYSNVFSGGESADYSMFPRVALKPPAQETQVQLEPASSGRVSGGIGVPSIRDKFKLNPAQVRVAQLAMPTEITEEQLRQRQDALANKDMEEYDAAINPLAARRKAMYEEQKARRATSADNAFDGILGTDIRGRRLGSGLAAMASGARRSQKESAALAAQQDALQLQSEELMARARMEARRGNRDAAARLIQEARASELARINAGNQQETLNAAGFNQGEANRVDTEKFTADRELKIRMANQQAAMEAQRIDAIRQKQAEGDKFQQEKLRLQAESRISQDTEVKKWREEAALAQRIGDMNKVAELQARVNKRRADLYAEVGLSPTMAASSNPAQPSGLPPGAVIHPLIPR